MGRTNPISIAVVVAAALFGCAKTQTHTSEPAATSRSADADPHESPAEGAATAAPDPVATRSVPDIRATCALEVERQIACVNEYIPMIVDVRIKLDFPSGIAERGRDEAGRQKIVAEAMQEFPEYYSVEKIPTICEQRQAMVEQMPPQVLEELLALRGGCHVEKDCEGFTRCVAPFVEKILAMKANAGAR